MAGYDFTPQDIEALTRVVVGEAGSEPDDGQAAVAHVVLNRLAAGGFGGKTPTSVILAGRGTATPQFEPTNNASSAFYTTYPGAPAYKKALGIVQGVIAGDIPDPTGGATNFYAPRAQQAMGRAAPSWATQNTPSAMIGGHVFYALKPGADGSSLLTPKPPQADNNPAHSMGSDDLPALAYAGSPAPAAPVAAPIATQGTPMPNSPPANAPNDFADMWGIDPKVMSAAPVGTQASALAPRAPSSNDFHSTWSINRSALDESPSVAPDAKERPTGENGLVWDKDGGRDPKTGELVIAGKPMSSRTPSQGLAAAYGVLGGVPIAGPALEEAAASAAGRIHGALTGDPVDQTTNALQGQIAASQQAYPKTTMAAQIGGAVAGTLPAALEAPAAFGIGKAPMLGRMLASGTTNALIGGADSFARGQDPTGGAALGILGGAGGPIAGKALGSGARYAANRLMTPSVDGMGRPAVNMLTGMLSADTPAAVQANAARLGPNAMLPDLGPSMSGIASGLATKPGDAKTAIFNALEQRAAGANGRITTDLNALLGPAEDPQQVTNAILAHRSATDAANYAAVHGQNAPVDPSGVVALIDQHLGTPANPIATGTQRTALQNLRNSIVSQPAAGEQPEAYHSGSQYFHNLRQEVDNLLSGSAPALGVPQGSVARTSGSLGAVRGALDDALKTQVPGMAHADAASAALASRAEALQQGTSILANGKQGITPTSFAQTYNAMNPGEQIALNKGARGEIDRLVGTAANDPAKLRNMLQGEGGWNTAKLATAFGAEPTEGLVNAVGREGEFSATNNRLLSNSQTAQRTAAAGLLKETDPAYVDFKSANPTGLLMQGGKKYLVDPLIKSLLSTDNGPRDAQLGHAMALQGDPRDALINQLIGAMHGSNNSAALAQLMDRNATMGGNMLMGQVAKEQYPELTVHPR